LELRSTLRGTRIVTSRRLTPRQRAQLGHASISQTVDTYGHVQPEPYEAAVEGLDRYVNPGVEATG